MIGPKPLISRSREAVWHEDNRRENECNRIIDSADIITKRTTKGTELSLVRRPSGGTPAPPTIARFQIREVQTSQLLCLKYQDDGTLETTDTVVLKPAKLRGGTTRSVTLPGTTSSITEELRPPYTVGDEIYATDDLNPITDSWIDLNIDGRNWLPEYRVVCVRISGVNRNMVVAGGPPF